MSFYLSLFYFFTGFLQFVPQLILLWSRSRALLNSGAPLEPVAAELSIFDSNILAIQAIPMVLLGVSFGMRDVQFAWENIDCGHDYKAQPTFA